MPDKEYKDKKETSRQDVLDAGGKEYALANVEGGEYLLQHLNNLGWCSSNGMGLSPISFIEIKAYIDTTETYLSGEEALLVHRMSQLYVNEINDKNPNKKAPFEGLETQLMSPNSIINAFAGIATISEAK